MTYQSYSTDTFHIFHTRKITFWEQINMLASGCIFKVIKVVVWLGNRNVGRSGRLCLLSVRALMKMVTHHESRSSLSVLAKPLPCRECLLLEL